MPIVELLLNPVKVPTNAWLFCDGQANNARRHHNIGGQDKIRELWRHYYENTEALIYVVDCIDTDRIEKASEELMKMLNEDCLKSAPLLIYANKQDLPGALSPNDLIEKMGLRQIKGREWIVQGTSALEGKGLSEGLDWMANALSKRR